MNQELNPAGAQPWAGAKPYWKPYTSWKTPMELLSSCFSPPASLPRTLQVVCQQLGHLIYCIWCGQSSAGATYFLSAQRQHLQSSMKICSPRELMLITQLSLSSLHLSLSPSLSGVPRCSQAFFVLTRCFSVCLYMGGWEATLLEAACTQHILPVGQRRVKYCSCPHAVDLPWCICHLLFPHLVLFAKIKPRFEYWVIRRWFSDLLSALLLVEKWSFSFQIFSHNEVEKESCRLVFWCLSESIILNYCEIRKLWKYLIVSMKILCKHTFIMFIWWSHQTVTKCQQSYLVLRALDSLDCCCHILCLQQTDCPVQWIA